jgi:hypothetical protein
VRPAGARGMSPAMARRSDGKGRGSPEAVEKRRSARALNSLFSRATGGLDGRTERRRKRLLAELKDGRGGEPISPIDVLTHAAELLSLGETMASIRKHGVRPRAVRADASLWEAARRVQKAYTLPDEVFELLGLDARARAERKDVPS